METLQGVPLFADLTKQQLREVVNACFEATYAEGATRVEELDHGEGTFVLLSGSARVVRNGRTIARLGPGETVGEMSLLDGRPRSTTVIADAPIEALVLSRTAFRTLLDHLPPQCTKLLLAQTARVRELDKRASSCG